MLAEMREQAWNVERASMAHVAAHAEESLERRMEQLETWTASCVADIEDRGERFVRQREAWNANHARIWQRKCSALRGSSLKRTLKGEGLHGTKPVHVRGSQSSRPRLEVFKSTRRAWRRASHFGSSWKRAQGSKFLRCV